MDALGVKISYQKYLISSSGAFEFAKRFFAGRADLSPISLRSLMMCKSVIGLLQIREKYSITNLALLARLGGAGYRVLARLNVRRSGRRDSS